MLLTCQLIIFSCLTTCDCTPNIINKRHKSNKYLLLLFLGIFNFLGQDFVTLVIEPNYILLIFSLISSLLQVTYSDGFDTENMHSTCRWITCLSDIFEKCTLPLRNPFITLERLLNWVRNVHSQRECSNISAENLFRPWNLLCCPFVSI